MNEIVLDEGFFQGAVSFEHGDGWIKPWRLPFDLLELFPPEMLIERAGKPAGVRLRLETSASRLGLAIVPAEVPRLFDLVIDNDLLQCARAEPGVGEVFFDKLPAGRKVVEVWLPQDQPVALRALLLPEGARALPAEDPRPRWVTYGSSITHCGGAHSPARTWPATAARARNLHLTCLGFGGQCHMDPMVALTIRDLPADVITLKLGINMHGGTTSPRTFRPGAIGLVRIIREKHPEVPIGLISPIVSPQREDTPGPTGMTLKMMRAELMDVVERLRHCGDSNVHYFDGTALFGPELVEDYLPDLLHPNGDGYEILGRNAAEKVLPKLGF